MSARSPLILLVLLASAAGAAPTLDPQYGDHAVVQRGKPIVLSGSAAPGERVKVSFAGAIEQAQANAAGRWQAAFPARLAGGPLTIEATGADSASAGASDVMIGDVWLCSGQSNMEYPLRRALNGDGEVNDSADEGLRVMKVPQQLAGEPQAQFEKRPAWQRAAPDSVKDFSAACYFLARDLRRTEKVPVGAIDDSWGGTPIRAWMNEAAVRAGGNGDAADFVELHRRDPGAATARFGEQWGAWWRAQTGDMLGAEPWHASDRLAWKPVPTLGYWDSWGPEWKSFDGAIWARKRVTLTAAEAAAPATLAMSAIDDMDETFVNGVAVGGMSAPVTPRSYPIAPGVLRAGENEILVYARDFWGPGGLAGPPDAFKLTFADGRAKSLADGWQYARIADSVGQPQVPPWDGSSGVSTIYNAMVAPLGPIGLKGVAWYQGEADVGQPGYDKRLAAWMTNWRTQFRDPDLDFLIVGLAGWGKPASAPTESGWAALIDEQRLATTRDPHAALASAIDLGEPNDIHPANKQEVGRRLALAAHSLVYRDGGAVGPKPVSALAQGRTVNVFFDKPLRALSGGSAIGFELCAPVVGCRYADAHASGKTVAIMGDGQPVTKVRYAWSDYPIVNLYDEDVLPVPVFEMGVGGILDQ
jgi:sialate O-acetylesterase